MRRDNAVSSLMDLNGRNMKRFQAFVLKLVVLDYRILAGDDFGYRIRKVDVICKSDIRLNNADLAIVSNDDQATRMRSDGLGRRRNEQEMNRRFDCYPRRYFYERSVFNESCVERDERLTLVASVSSEVRLDSGRFAVDCFGEARCDYSLAQIR